MKNWIDQIFTNNFKMKKKYKKVIYIFSCIILFSIIGGVVKFSLRYIDNNPDLYIPKTKDIST